MEEIAKLLPNIPDTWIPFNTVDWNDKSILAYHIDTRDFHVNCCTESDTAKDINETTISKKEYKNKFYFTSEEVSILIKRLFDESGGSKEWRFLSFGGEWIKYIRIYRKEDLFLVCSRDNYARNKEYWNSDVASQY